MLRFYDGTVTSCWLPPKLSVEPRPDTVGNCDAPRSNWAGLSPMPAAGALDSSPAPLAAGVFSRRGPTVGLGGADGRGERDG